VIWSARRWYGRARVKEETKIPETAEADLLEDGLDPDADVELDIDDEFDAEIDPDADDVTVEVVAEYIEFELGDNVVYPHHGAGKVCAKEMKEVFGERREYLTIKILHNDMTVMVPTENATLAGLRRVIDEETVQKVLDVLRDDVSDMPKNWNRRFKHNRDKIKTGDIYELSEVVRNLALREHEKGLSSGEKQMYTRTKKILASELMYALDKSESEAEDYLDELLSRSSDAETLAPRR
jgi:CarD family transcriptional regulator